MWRETKSFPQPNPQRVSARVFPMSAERLTSLLFDFMHRVPRAAAMSHPSCWQTFRLHLISFLPTYWSKRQVRGCSVPDMAAQKHKGAGRQS